MIKVCVLASSSKGNCTVVIGEKDVILIDAGICKEEIERGLQMLNLSFSRVTAILATHEHSDHCKSIGSILREFKTRLYVHANGTHAMIKKVGKVDKDLIINFYEMPFELGEFTVKPFCLPHDSAACVGYTIENNGKRITYATDLGHITEEIEKNMYNSTLVILESNHDEKRLLANPHYPAWVKKRVLGPNGHISNVTAAKVVCNLACNNVKQVLLAHLSEENNTPEICYETLCSYLTANQIVPQKHIKIDIAPARSPSNIFVIK